MTPSALYFERIRAVKFFCLKAALCFLFFLPFGFIVVVVVVVSFSVRGKKTNWQREKKMGEKFNVKPNTKRFNQTINGVRANRLASKK